MQLSPERESPPGLDTIMDNQSLSRLLELEARRQLADRDVLGYPIWTLERFRRYREGLVLPDRQPGLSGVSSGKPERRGRKRFLIKESFADLVRDIRGRSNRDIWVLSASTYRRTAEGSFPCIFTYDLQEQLGDRLLYLERNSAGIPSLERQDTVFLDSILIPLSMAAERLAPLFARAIDSEQREAFAPTPAKQLAQLALYGHGLETMASQLLRRARPRAVFVLCSYGPFLPVQRAVKRLGIPLIELQHGIIHDSHAGYVLRGPRVSEHAPHHTCVFGNRFGRTLERCSDYWVGRWSVAGHPWLRRHAAGIRWNERPESRRIVVFSQNIAPVREQLKVFLPDLRRRLRSEFEILLKPHPGERDAEQFYREAVSSGVQLAAPSADSYQLLKECALAVSVYSTIALEALAFPCQSLVLRSPLWSQEIRHAVEQGTLLAADEAGAVVRAIEEPSTATERRALADDLFALSRPAPDFAGLIEQIRDQCAGDR